MIDTSGAIDRRRLFRVGVGAGAGVALMADGASGRLAAAAPLLTASGAGVNLKLMPDEAGQMTVPMRESFAFDATYAQCIVEDNAKRFAMDTFGLGRVIIEPHQFFMAMYADTVAIHDIRQEPSGALTATLFGALFCATFAGTASVSVGSRDAQEHARFKIEATDGGYGASAPPDRFAFTVYFDPKAAPVNHSIFGPEFTFTGEMIAGRVTIGPPITLPLSVATPTPGTPTA